MSDSEIHIVCPQCRETFTIKVWQLYMAAPLRCVICNAHIDKQAFIQPETPDKRYTT